MRHALIGGLAVGGYGYPRATKDVDFLVGDEAFEHHGGGLVTFRPGIPIQVKDVTVDLLGDDLLSEELESPLDMGGLPVVSAEALIYLKLKAFRRRDQQDIVELLRRGADEARVKRFLGELPDAEDLLSKLESLTLESDDVEERAPRRMRAR